MKAVLAKEFAPPARLVLEDLPPVSAGPGEVVIAVTACGVNFFDGLPLARYREALAAVMNRKVRGKVVLVMD